jgi:CDGSH-type Zn-finger protein
MGGRPGPRGASPPSRNSKPASGSTMKIVVSTNGPYLVSGGIPLEMQTIRPNAEGFSWEWEKGRTFETTAEYQLCRCGHSSHKPFCDGTHARIHFDGTETATRQPYDRQAESIDGPTLSLSDTEVLCAFARFCDPGGKIWALVPASDDPAARKLAIREEMQCPGGRLVLRDKESGERIEPSLPRSIGVVEDAALQCSGPLWVRGGIRVESANGVPYELRNRVALCRCGASSNKPFCNGSHASIQFNDGLV